jgi:hypothetical protein
MHSNPGLTNSYKYCTCSKPCTFTAGCRVPCKGATPCANWHCVPSLQLSMAKLCAAQFTEASACWQPSKDNHLKLRSHY